MHTTHIAVDTSKTVFTLHASDAIGHCTGRFDLKRAKFLAYFEKQPSLTVTLEACGGSHHWGRELTRLGHVVRLIAPLHVKPFLKRGKNDRADAEAISEAASRPSMRFVPVKNAQTQAAAMMQSTRQLLVRQRTALINAMRGHPSEFGLVVGRGTENVAALLAAIAGLTELPELARELCAELGGDVATLDARISSLDRKLAALHKSNPMSQNLATIPGVGPVAALTLATNVDPARFTSGAGVRRLSGFDAKRSFQRRQAAAGWD